jgi:hypothetical protein
MRILMGVTVILLMSTSYVSAQSTGVVSAGSKNPYVIAPNGRNTILNPRHRQRTIYDSRGRANGTIGKNWGTGQNSNIIYDRWGRIVGRVR